MNAIPRLFTERRGLPPRLPTLRGLCARKAARPIHLKEWFTWLNVEARSRA